MPGAIAKKQSLEAGDVLSQQLNLLSGAAAGILRGAGVPIMPVSRAERIGTRIASCTTVVLVARCDVKP